MLLQVTIIACAHTQLLIQVQKHYFYQHIYNGDSLFVPTPFLYSFHAGAAERVLFRVG